MENTTSSDITPKHRKHKKPNLPHHTRRRDSSEALSRPKTHFQSLSIDSTHFSDSDDIWQEQKEHHLNWTFPADMSPLDRQTWSNEHTEQGEPRHTVPHDLQHFKRCKPKEDPTDQELLELSNLPGRNSSNSTVELQIKGLSRYLPTYSDEELETKRIARFSNLDDQASREAEDRYLKRRSSTRK